MTQIKPLKITPIEILWCYLAHSPELAFHNKKKDINLGNIDVSVILSWVNVNRLLTIEQIEELRQKIDKEADKITEEQANTFYEYSLMNTLFEVCQNIPASDKENVLAIGIDTVINYFHHNNLLPKNECDHLSELFAENIEKIIKNCPVKQAQKELSDC